MSLYPNRRSGKCSTCNAPVAASAGFVARKPNGYGWDCFCNSDQCIPERLQTQLKNADRKELTAEGELYFPYDPAALGLLRAFPPTREPGKRFWDAEKKCRHVSLEAEDRRRVLELCEQLGVTVAEELKEVPTDNLVKSAMGRCDQIPTLYGYQREGVRFLAEHRQALLADDMGLGKTLQALLAVDPSMGAIVVCPSAVKYNWAEEVHKWRPDLSCKVMVGRDSFQPPLPGEVVISNFEILPKWLMPVTLGTDPSGREIKGARIPALPSLKRTSFKNIALIVDEAHRARNYRTQTHKKVQELARICGRVWFLTGTPLMNKPTDLYGVLQAGFMDRQVFGGWKGFVRSFNGSRSGFRGAYVWGHPSPDVPEKMRRVMLRRLKEEVLEDLPSTVWKDVHIDFTGKKREVKELDDAYERVRSHLERGALPAFEELSKVRNMLANSRIPALMDMVSDFEEAGEPLVVFSAYRAPIDQLGERDGWETITGDVSAQKRQEIVRRFQAGELKGVALTIAAGGVGLTLTRASNILFVDLDWVPANNAQAIDRIRRIGQKASSVQVIRMVSKHPVDLRVHELLAQKMEMIRGAIEDRIEYTPTEKKPSVEIRKESQESALKRKQELEAQEAKKVMENKDYLQGESAKASRPEVDLTPQVAVKLRDALKYMLKQCDGAHAKDNVGFSKPDAGRARVLVRTGLTTEQELRAAERMLSRYYRQLSDKYPELFCV